MRQARDAPSPRLGVRACDKKKSLLITQATHSEETPGSCALAQDFGVSEAEALMGGQGGDRDPEGLAADASAAAALPRETAQRTVHEPQEARMWEVKRTELV